MKALSIITVLISMLSTVIFVLFVHGMSVIGTFWGNGAQAGTSPILLCIIALLTLPAILVLIANFAIKKNIGIKKIFIITSFGISIAVILSGIGIVSSLRDGMVQSLDAPLVEPAKKIKGK